jgi:hypothetical protein
LRLDLADDDLVGAARGIDFDVTETKHGLTIREVERKLLCNRAPHYTANLGRLIFKSKVQVAATGTRKIGDFSRNPKRRERPLDDRLDVPGELTDRNRAGCCARWSEAFGHQPDRPVLRLSLLSPIS